MKTFLNKEATGESTNYNNRRDDITYVTYSRIQIRDLEIGDEVKIELWSLDENTYKFYSTLENSSGGSFIMASTPANPESNIIPASGVLGYFGAVTIRSDSVVITD